MSYASCTAAVLTLVRAYSGGTVFTSANSAEDDYQTVLGQSATGAVVTMFGDSAEGDMLDGRGAQGKRQARHEIGVVLLVPIGGDNDAVPKAALHTIRDALIAYLRPYARLNNASGVKRAEIVAQTQDRLLGPTNEQGTHWVSVIVLRVWEEVSITYATGDSPG